MADSKSKKVHPLVQAFVIFHLLMVFIFSIPTRTDEQKVAIAQGTAPIHIASLYHLERLVRDPKLPTGLYMLSTGLWQSWDMFAPDPSKVDIWRDSIVTFQDGTETIHPYPRMKTLPIAEKYLFERFRKYNERLNNDSYGWKWRHTSYRVAYEAWKDPANPPTRVQLRRHWLPIQPPPNLTPMEYKSFVHWEEVIQLEELRRFKER
ncbi:MAG: hypothetical protein MUC92_07165 [Fimbriimonadaceae bacterium]|jgi:hypothetical protein|nr:hypothetical protein [Fimbriimonadaceae bacterium]